MANYRVITRVRGFLMGESMNEENPEVIAKTAERLKELAPNARMIPDDNTRCTFKWRGKCQDSFTHPR